MADKVYIASIGVLSGYANKGVEGQMISIIGDYCKKQRVKYIGTHIRGTNTILRLQFKNKGFLLTVCIKSLDDLSEHSSHSLIPIQLLAYQFL